MSSQWSAIPVPSVKDFAASVTRIAREAAGPVAGVSTWSTERASNSATRSPSAVRVSGKSTGQAMTSVGASREPPKWACGRPSSTVRAAHDSGDRVAVALDMRGRDGPAPEVDQGERDLAAPPGLEVPEERGHVGEASLGVDQRVGQEPAACQHRHRVDGGRERPRHPVDLVAGLGLEQVLDRGGDLGARGDVGQRVHEQREGERRGAQREGDAPVDARSEPVAEPPGGRWCGVGHRSGRDAHQRPLGCEPGHEQVLGAERLVALGGERSRQALRPRRRIRGAPRAPCARPLGRWSRPSGRLAPGGG